jgi:hypothetical protein
MVNKYVTSAPGNTNAADGTIIDVYEVTYDGLERPLRLYLDWYHFNDQSAPQGLICGQPIGLGLPPADPFRTTEDMVSLAVEQGVSREFAPIPLSADGGSAQGVAFDQFRLIARASQAAAKAGKPLDSKSLPPDLLRPRIVILAHGVTCDGRSIAPVAIDIVAAQGAAVRREGEYAKDSAIAALLPGLEVPASSLAAAFALQSLRPTDAVKITYAEAACPTGATDVTLPVKYTLSRPLQTPMPTLPEGTAAGGIVRFQVLIDPDGLIQRPFVLGGPAPLIPSATEILKQWRAEPVRVNGVPLVTSVVVQVKFK